MNPVFNVLQGHFQSVAPHLQCVALAVAKKTATLCNVLRNRSVAQCVARKAVSTECVRRQRNSATLLSSINYISMNTYTYGCVYRRRLYGHPKVVRSVEMVVSA